MEVGNPMLPHESSAITITCIAANNRLIKNQSSVGGSGAVVLGPVGRERLTVEFAAVVSRQFVDKTDVLRRLERRQELPAMGDDVIGRKITARSRDHIGDHLVAINLVRNTDAGALDNFRVPAEDIVDFYR